MIKSIKTVLSITLISGVIISCSGPGDSAQDFTGAENEVRIMTLNPGHFHAALVHKYDYDQVDPNVDIYTPGGAELDAHMALIEQFNSRTDETPTSWVPEIHTGDDYLERMLEEKPGNVMVVAGNNARKIDYIHQAVRNGINVLADKPMVIHPDDFPLLKQAMESADEQGLVVNDIMTERYNIANAIQRELSVNPDVFGELEKGSPEDPAIISESIHFFYKTVAGEPLIRPAWFFDVTQQGEAIADVSTHLVDQVLWKAFPDESIDYENPDDGVEVLTGRIWNTEITLEEFTQATNVESFPDYLMADVDDNNVFHATAHGEFVFKVRDVYARVYAGWDYENPGGADTHFTVMRGTKADLVIRQDEEQDFVATLYVEPAEGADQQEFQSVLEEALADISDRYPGLSTEWTEYGFEISVPDELQEGHEDHFTRVTEQYLRYLVDGELADWERTNILTKYYITTTAYELSR